MRKSIVILLFLALALSSCMGTKYASTGYLTSKANTEETSDPAVQYSKINIEDLDNISQEDVDLPITEVKSDSHTSNLADFIIENASDNLGVRYRFGGTNKSGFDCSGLVFTSFKAYDITLPRSSYEMAQYGMKIKESEAQKGDLVFFITNGGRRINHVGIVTEVLDDEIKFIHSSTQLGVIISSTKEPYYKKNFVKIHRVL